MIKLDLPKLRIRPFKGTPAVACTIRNFVDADIEWGDRGKPLFLFVCTTVFWYDVTKKLSGSDVFRQDSEGSQKLHSQNCPKAGKWPQEPQARNCTRV